MNELDLLELTKKQTEGRKPTEYYEDSSGNITAKKCSRCGEVKALSDFNKSATKFAGRRSECRECSKAYAKKHYAENRERRKEYRRLYYEVNEKKAEEWG